MPFTSVRYPVRVLTLSLLAAPSIHCTFHGSPGPGMFGTVVVR